MYKLHHFILKNKLSASIVGLIFLGVIVFLASQIKLEEDVTSLIPSGEKQNVLKKVLQQSRLTDKIIVTISSEEAPPEELIKYAGRFIDSVHKELPGYVKNVQGKVPDEGIREIYNFVYNHLPLFLNDSDYQKIEQKLQTDSISQLLKENYKTLISPTGLVTRDFLFKDPLALTPLGLNKLQELQVGDNFLLYHNFLFTKDRQHLLLFINPKYPSSETDKNQIFIRKLSSITLSLNKDFKDVKAEYFGGVLYSLANANQIKKDIKITISIAVFILLVLLILYYRKFYVPLLLFIPSLIGAVTAIAFLFLLEKTISAISIGIGSILLGISIDYALHILTHYKNNNDLKQLYKDITIPVLMSSGTTAIAFLCLLFVKSKALNDLGIFAAISVMVASVAALLLTPLLYKAPADTRIEQNTWLDKFAAIEFHKNKFLVVLVLLLFTGGLFFFTHVTFNNDLSSINYVPENVKNVEKRVEDIAGEAAKSIYLISYGKTPDDALEVNNKVYSQLTNLKDQGVVASYSSIGGVVLSTSTQLDKIEKWKDFWNSGKKEKIRSDLIKASSRYGFKPQSFDRFYSLVSKDFDPIYLKDY
ncbi:MAG: MMPL family transporter, partial [Gillisia sp.]